MQPSSIVLDEASSVPYSSGRGSVGECPSFAVLAAREVAHLAQNRGTACALVADLRLSAQVLFHALIVDAFETSLAPHIHRAFAFWEGVRHASWGTEVGGSTTWAANSCHGVLSFDAS